MFSNLSLFACGRGGHAVALDQCEGNLDGPRGVRRALEHVRHQVHGAHSQAVGVDLKGGQRRDVIFARVGVVEADDAHISRHLQPHTLEQTGQADRQRVVHADGGGGALAGPEYGRQLLTRIWHLGNQLRGCTDKLVFSFADVLAYRKVQQNLLRDTACFTKENVTSAEPSPAQQQELVEGLVKLRDHWHAEGWQLTLATCAEQIDLDAYGIAHNRCIDSELIARLWHNDPELLYYLHTGKLPEPDLFGNIPPLPATAKPLKDKGQRHACGCIPSKDIGMYNTCPHLCAYCYANASRATILANHLRHNPAAPSLIPPDADTTFTPENQ